MADDDLITRPLQAMTARMRHFMPVVTATARAGLLVEQTGTQTAGTRRIPQPDNQHLADRLNLVTRQQ